MCGLVGWVGNDPKKFNFAKLYTLGVLNEVRGRHSCGASYDGEIYAGVDKEKLFRNFAPRLKATMQDDPMQNGVVIGHTRWATGGAHNIANSHPFGFGTNGDKYEMIGAHNGSLLDYEDLAQMFDVEVEQVTGFKTTGKKRNRRTTPITRKKIDSEVLLEIIHKDGIEVLDHYLGAAALLWYDTNDSNVLYAYHGKSKMYKSSVSAVEERPLHYLKDGEGSLYISSIPESLKTINDNGGEVGEFEFNTVYKITGGDIENAEKFPVNRGQGHQKEWTAATRTAWSGNTHNAYSSGGGSGFTSRTGSGVTTTVASRSVATQPKKEVILLQKEKVKAKMSDVNSNIVYYNRLRYWRGDKLITGVFTPLKDNDMAFLHFDPAKAMEVYKGISDARKYTESPLLFYFFRGVRMDKELDYKMATAPTANHTITALSHMSKYPIVDLANENAKIMHMGKTADQVVLPYLSKKLYTFVKGDCVDADEYSDGIDETDFCFLLECDRIVTSVIAGNMSVDTSEIDDEEYTDEMSNSDDETVLSLCCEDIDSSFDDCITDISDHVEDETIKNDAISLFASVKNLVKEKLECLIKK